VHLGDKGVHLPAVEDLAAALGRVRQSLLSFLETLDSAQVQFLIVASPVQQLYDQGVAFVATPFQLAESHFRSIHAGPDARPMFLQHPAHAGLEAVDVGLLFGLQQSRQDPSLQGLDACTAQQGLIPPNAGDERCLRRYLEDLGCLDPEGCSEAPLGDLPVFGWAFDLVQARVEPVQCDDHALLMRAAIPA
jgi:hypothetical protein